MEKLASAKIGPEVSMWGKFGNLQLSSITARGVVAPDSPCW